MRMTIAIDGPAAAGKGTIARALAAHFGFAYLDTGLLYRATGAKVADGMTPLEAARDLTPNDLARDDLRSAAAGQAASVVAADTQVRAALVDFQRAFARRPEGAVLDGRDIGTVICPDADVKLFVTATDAVRAQRRWVELSDPALSYGEVLADLSKRDARDAARDTAPLRAADDALSLDTTHLSVAEAVTVVIGKIEAVLAGRGAR